ncbi:MAG: hypothetical protein WDM96_05040 [Lacunisphaera sp.]
MRISRARRAVLPRPRRGRTAGWFRHGWVTPGAQPGFGLELNEKTARRYALPGAKWFDESS